MENKHILRRVIVSSLIFAAAVFVFEEVLPLTLGVFGGFILILVLTPFRIACATFGLEHLWQHTLDRQCFHWVAAANALLWSIPFAIVHWGILPNRTPTKNRIDNLNQGKSNETEQS